MSAADRNSSVIENGSITVFLSLILCVILSLIFACISSARISAGRAALSCAVEEGMFSLFSNYDKELYEEYGLMFLDGGYGTSEFYMGSIVDEAMEYTDKVLSPAVGFAGVTPSKLYDISLDHADVTGYVLATDSGYAPLVEQIREIVLLKLGTDALETIGDSVDIYSQAVKEYSVENEDELDLLTKKYEQQKELAEQLKAEAEAQNGGSAQEDDPQTEAAPADTEIPADFVNPIDNINKLRKLGLMSFAFPDGASLSDASFDLSDTVSQRTLNRGMGLLPDDGYDMLDKLAVSEFALGFFPDFLSAEDSETLQYQAEYIISGKADDSANLKAVMNRLLFIRLGLNYIYLLSSADKSAEIYEIASIVSAILLMPEGIEAVAQITRIMWAYAESMMDVKSLLSGGKVPIFKDNSTWQVSLSLFSFMNSGTQPQENQKGLTYQEYLRILMYMMPNDDLIERTADMIEYNRRAQDVGFCLDMCMSDLQIEIHGYISGKPMSINRGYSYNV